MDESHECVEATGLCLGIVQRDHPVYWKSKRKISLIFFANLLLLKTLDEGASSWNLNLRSSQCDRQSLLH